HRDRAGLIGPNGTGKSSLMKILCGRLEPDGGSVQLVRKAQAGYLPQELAELPPGSILDGVLASVPGRTFLETRIEAAEAALAQAAGEEEQLTLGWFDDFLRRSRKALLLVSHDREFLDRQISRVLSFEPEGLRAYPGNYEDYLGQRADEEEQLAARAERQEKRRAQTLAFIDRFRAKASKARQA